MLLFLLPPPGTSTKPTTNATTNIIMQPIESLKSFLHVLEGKSEEQEKQILLLVRPSFDGFMQTMTSLYEYLEYEVPEDLKKTQLHPGVLNYTYTKPDTSDGSKNIVEVYTIFNPSYQNLSIDYQLINILQKYSTNINVIMFVNCIDDELTRLINSFNEDSTVSETQFKKDTIIPALHTKIDPFFNTISDTEWKSCNIILSNVSKWSYKSVNVQIIDFVQQLLRSLLHHQYSTETGRSRAGFLAYFSFDIADCPKKTKKMWSEILSNDTKSLSILSDSSDNSIKYNDIFIQSSQDSTKNINLLEDTFEWSEWLSIWNNPSH